MYFRLDEIDNNKAYTYLSDFGKYAAFNIKGYIVSKGNKELVWNQHFSMGGNSEIRIFVSIITDDDYYIYEYNDVLGRKYEQIVRISGKESNGLFDFYVEAPILIE